MNTKTEAKHIDLKVNVPLTPASPDRTPLEDEKALLERKCSTSHISPRLLKTRQAARYLGVSAWKLRNLVQSGEIACILGDGTSPWLFDIQDLHKWIERRKQTL